MHVFVKKILVQKHWIAVLGVRPEPDMLMRVQEIPVTKLRMSGLGIVF
jgi:hypothetical protein